MTNGSDRLFAHAQLTGVQRTVTFRPDSALDALS